MKSLFILLTLIILSCKQTTSNIISKVEVHKDSCYYKVNKYWKRDGSLCCTAYILEPCGKFKNGDTLYGIAKIGFYKKISKN